MRAVQFATAEASAEEVAASGSEPNAGALSRASTLDADLNKLNALEVPWSNQPAGSTDLSKAATAASGERPAEGLVIHNWSLRPPAANDYLLRISFRRLLDESNQAATDAERLVMYDATDEGEVRQALGMGFRRRLDARRSTKPKKPEAQTRVCTPFDPDAFNFSKIRNDRERVLKLQLGSGRYDVLSNRFPLFPKHMLLVAGNLVPQQMSRAHLDAVIELLHPTTFCAYFNSWCASASVNHFHCHLIDEFPPVTAFPLVAGPVVGMLATPAGTPLPGFRVYTPQGFPGRCYVYPTSAIVHIAAVIEAMQADNQPHNLLITPRYVYVFPKPHARPPRSFALYPETVGGPELIGSFTVYNRPDYEKLTPAVADELVRINTAPLPSRLLQRGGHGSTVDDGAVHSAATTTRGARLQSPRFGITASKTMDFLPMYTSRLDSSLDGIEPKILSERFDGAEAEEARGVGRRAIAGAAC